MLSMCLIQQIVPPCKKTADILFCEMLAKQLQVIHNIKAQEIIKLEIQGIKHRAKYSSGLIYAPNYSTTSSGPTGCSHSRITCLIAKEISALWNFEIEET